MPLTFKYKFGTVRCKIRSRASERGMEKIFRTIELQVTFMDCWLHTCNEVQYETVEVVILHIFLIDWHHRICWNELSC